MCIQAIFIFIPLMWKIVWYGWFTARHNNRSDKIDVLVGDGQCTYNHYGHDVCARACVFFMFSSFFSFLISLFSHVLHTTSRESGDLLKTPRKRIQCVPIQTLVRNETRFLRSTRATRLRVKRNVKPKSVFNWINRRSVWLETIQ